METLNLTPQQLRDSNLGIVFSNMVYDLNNAARNNIPSVIQVDQPLPSGVTELKGSASHYFLSNHATPPTN